MKSLFLPFIIMMAIGSFANVCEVAGHYRCKNGSTGVVVGHGVSVEEAKLDARNRARELCNGQVDYIHFRESIRT